MAERESKIVSWPGLAIAIDRMYAVFGKYRLQEASRKDAEWFCRFRKGPSVYATPLRNLTTEQLSAAVGGILTSWGTDDDFKYLLPRFCEMTAVDEQSSYDRAGVFSRIRIAKWQQWPVEERSALLQFTHEVVRAGMNTYPHNRPCLVDDYLCGAAHIDDDMRPLLDAISEPTSDECMANIIEVFDWNWGHLMQVPMRLANGFWHDRPDQMKEVLAWLLSIDRRAIADFYEASRDRPLFWSGLNGKLPRFEDLGLHA